MILCGHEVLQDMRFFPLTQDSVLLAHFSAPKNGTRILDLGAGQGYLGILLREKADVIVDGLELSPEAAEIAMENYLRCGVGGTVTAGDWRELPRGMTEQYALCVFNPPYFPAGSGPRGKRGTARTAETGAEDALCRSAARALQNGGRCCLCCPPDFLASWIRALQSAGLEPKRLQPICRRAEIPPYLLLLEGKKGGKAGLRWLHPLVLETSAGTPAAELKQIYGGAE